MSSRPPVLPPDDEPGLGAAHTAAESDPAGPVASSGTYRRRRLAVLGVAGLLVIAALVVVARALEPDATPPPSERIDAWLPYWTLDGAADEVASYGSRLTELSPFWYAATSAASIEVDPNASAAAVEAVLAAARDTRARIVPSIADRMPAGGMAAVLADPVTRAQHVDALVSFADTTDADGLDLDYEQFAFADDRATWATTRPNWVAFVTELARELHADGRTLTVSIPPVYDAGRTDDSGYWVYDYGAIAPVVDAIRIMAYDYSTASPGPIAPLEFVERVIAGAVEASGRPDRLVLGIPLYGYNWPVSTSGTCPSSAPDTGRTTVTTRTVAELAARRGATPVADPTTGEWTFSYPLVHQDATGSCTQQRQVHYVGTDGAVQRVQLARDAGLAGVSLWALGYEDATLWSALDALAAPDTEETGS